MLIITNLFCHVGNKTEIHFRFVEFLRSWCTDINGNHILNQIFVYWSCLSISCWYILIIMLHRVKNPLNSVLKTVGYMFTVQEKRSTDSPSWQIPSCGITRLYFANIFMCNCGRTYSQVLCNYGTEFQHCIHL